MEIEVKARGRGGNAGEPMVEIEVKARGRGGNAGEPIVVVEIEVMARGRGGNAGEPMGDDAANLPVVSPVHDTRCRPIAAKQQNPLLK